jgi:hypothetical protein
MSFLRQEEIDPLDEGTIPRDRALSHRKDESSTGYSLAGRAPEACPGFTRWLASCWKTPP